MIALNELLNNINHYQEMYNKMNLNVDLKSFIDLENERKIIQLEFEYLKADCNKKCHEFALKKNNGEDLKSLYNEILNADKKIKELESQLEKYNKIINKELNKLHNLPDEFISENIEIDTRKNESKIINLINNNFDMNFDIQTFDKSMYAVIKSIKNELFLESTANKKFICNDGIIILTTDFNVDKLFNNILEYLKNNSLKIIKQKTILNKKSSAIEYLIKLNEIETITMELKREFYTRQYNIKYKSTKIDMTKFLNQINIKFNKR